MKVLANPKYQTFYSTNTAIHGAAALRIPTGSGQASLRSRDPVAPSSLQARRMVKVIQESPKRRISCITTSCHMPFIGLKIRPPGRNCGDKGAMQCSFIQEKSN
jgi:hypothetical protein